MPAILPGQTRGKKRLGLIVNPVAGLGGRVGLKGSDGLEIQRKALALGAVSEVQARTCLALEGLHALETTFELVTWPGEMGEVAARQAGFAPQVVGSIIPGATTPEDTCQAAKTMLSMGVNLLLFAGGDGTARDIFNAIGDRLPALGIPAGVKIHSAVFATQPRHAGELAALYLQGRSTHLREAEVLDLDEDAFRAGLVSARLYGYLKIPFRRQLVQGQKVPTPASEAAAAEAIALDVVEGMQDGWLYILGPGTTTRAIARCLGLEKTLVGVDVVTRRHVAAADANEAQLLHLLAGQLAKIIVTPIGGQGFIFGRGNQQLSPAVLRQVGRDNILVVSTPHKLHALGGRPLLVDTGDPQMDTALVGYIPVKTGYHESSIYRVAA